MSVAGTYAEALFEAARDAGAVDQVASDLAAFSEAYSGSEELREALADPGVSGEERKAAIAEAAGDAHRLVVSFLSLLVDRHRVDDLPEIAEAFSERVARAEGRLEVEAVTALPLPPDLRERIVEKVREGTGADVELTESVDPEIVGGLVLRVGGVVVDGSLRQRLEGLRRSLVSAPVDAAAER